MSHSSGGYVVEMGGAVGKHHSEGDIGLDIKDESESSRQRDR